MQAAVRRGWPIWHDSCLGSIARWCPKIDGLRFGMRLFIDIHQMLLIDGSVGLCGGQGCVAQELLDCAKIAASF